MTQTHKYIGLSLGLLLGLSACSEAANAAGGSFGGTTSCDYGTCTVVEDCTDLSTIGTDTNLLDDNYILIPTGGADSINCSAFNNNDEGSAFITIGGTSDGFVQPLPEEPFSGNFDGNHKTIDNFEADYTAGYRGLFGRVEAGSEIKNLRITNARVGGYGFQEDSDVHGILVAALSGTVSNIYTQGIGVGLTTGGIAGIVYDGGEINNSYTEFTMSSGIRGGAIAAVNNGTIENVFASGSVTADKVGGISAESTNGIFNNIYTSVNVTGGSNGGDSIVATCSTCTVNSNSYYESDNNCTSNGGACPNSYGGAVTAGQEIYNSENFILKSIWDFTPGTGVWTFVQEKAYPALQWENYTPLAGAGNTSIEDTESTIAASGTLIQKKKDSAQAKIDYVQFLAGEDFNEELDPTDSNADNISNALKLMVRDVFKDQTVLDQLARTVEIFIGLTPNSIDPATRSTVPGAIRDWRCENGLGC